MGYVSRMNRTAWVVVAVGFLLGVAVGVSLTLRLGEPAVIREEAASRAQEPLAEPALSSVAEQAAWLRRELAAARAELNAERAKNQQAQAALEVVMAQRAAALATLEIAHVPPGAEKPVPFPPDAGVFAEATFRETVKELVEKCSAQLGWGNAQVDCDEYPCQVFFDESGERQKDYSLKDCAPWERRYPNSAMHMERSPDGGTGHFGLFALPSDDPQGEAIFFRSRDRFTRHFP